MLSPLTVKKPARIGVCFMGDLFGDWVDLNETFYFPVSFEKAGDGGDFVREQPLKELIYETINSCPQHTFVFLTKNPAGLLKWSPFPDNCWVGVSAWDGLSFASACEELEKVQAKVKFISLEPFLDWDMASEDTEYWVKYLDWLIIGAQTQPKKLPEFSWVETLVDAADRTGTRVFLKNNLNCCEISDHPLLLDANGDMRQELPDTQMLEIKINSTGE